MRNSKKPQRLNLEEFLDKIVKLKEVLEATSNKYQENVKWYCDYSIKRYYKRYTLFSKGSIVKYKSKGRALGARSTPNASPQGSKP